VRAFELCRNLFKLQANPVGRQHRKLQILRFHKRHFMPATCTARHAFQVGVLSGGRLACLSSTLAGKRKELAQFLGGRRFGFIDDRAPDLL